MFWDVLESSYLVNFVSVSVLGRKKKESHAELGTMAHAGILSTQESEAEGSEEMSLSQRLKPLRPLSSMEVVALGCVSW